MNSDLESVVREYVEKVGFRTALRNSINGFEGTILLINDEKIEKDMTPSLMFKMAIIEFLFFHDDTLDKAICLGKKAINDNKEISNKDKG